jgi:citrate lyase synthetase
MVVTTVVYEGSRREDVRDIVCVTKELVEREGNSQETQLDVYTKTKTETVFRNET